MGLRNIMKFAAENSMYVEGDKVRNEGSKELLDLLPKVEIYQPLYNVSLFKEPRINLEVKRLEV